jgi:hypothetical protein
MGKMKALWQAEQEKIGLASDGVFSDYVNDEVWAMRSEFMKQMNSVMVRDEYDLWSTHDGQGDN